MRELNSFAVFLVEQSGSLNTWEQEEYELRGWEEDVKEVFWVQRRTNGRTVEFRGYVERKLGPWRWDEWSGEESRFEKRFECVRKIQGRHEEAQRPIVLKR